MPYLTWPACSDINLNPPICCECGGLLEMTRERYRCRKCQTAWQDRLRDSIEADVKRMNDYLHGKRERRLALQVAKPPDRNYRKIIFASVWLITFGYLLLIYWCLTR